MGLTEPKLTGSIQSVKRRSTQERILDMAVHLFATKGYHNTSLREITAEAKVNLAAVNYHFGSKEKLLFAVLNRYLVPINKKRLAMLEHARQTAHREGRSLRIEELMRAFFESVFDILESHEGGMDFLAIVSQIHIDPDDTIRRLFLQMIESIVRTFNDAIREVLPHMSRDSIIQRFMFSIGAMIHAVTNLIATDEVFEILGKGPTTVDIRTIIEELIGFTTRGMEG